MKRRISMLLAILLMCSAMLQPVMAEDGPGAAAPAEIAEAEGSVAASFDDADATPDDEILIAQGDEEVAEAAPIELDSLTIGEDGETDEPLPLLEADAAPEENISPITASYAKVAVDAAQVLDQTGAPFAEIYSNSIVLVTGTADPCGIAFDTGNGVMEGSTAAQNLVILNEDEINAALDAMGSTALVLYQDQWPLVPIDCSFVTAGDGDPEEDDGTGTAIDPEGTDGGLENGSDPEGDIPTNGGDPEDGTDPDDGGDGEGFDISARALELYVGDSYAIKAVDSQGDPIDGSELGFLSSNESVATVDEAGVVTAVGSGSAEISVDYDGALLKSVVSVPVEPTGISIQAPRATIGKGETYAGIDAVLEPTGSKAVVKWSLADKKSKKYLKIDASTGRIKGVKAGTATIRATVTTSKGTFTASRKIAVKKVPKKIYLPGSFNVGISQIGEKAVKIPATFKPASATWQITWTSSNKQVLEVDETTGVLIPHAVSETTPVTITATTYKGKHDTCKVYVRPDPTGIILASSAALHVGATATLKPHMVPATAVAKNRYYSSDPSVVKVDEATGKVTAVKPGRANISAVSYNGKRSTNVCVVTVYKKPTKIALNRTSTVKLGAKGMTYQFSATVYPALPAGSNYVWDRGNPNVTWSSSNNKIATVDQNGLVTTKGKTGTAKITIKTSNGKKATCKVKVYAAPSSVKLNLSSLKLCEGGLTFAGLKASVKKPSSAYASFTYESSDPDVVRLDGRTITTGRTGTATITAKAQNGVSATCKVTVLAMPTKVSIPGGNVTFENVTSFTPTVCVEGSNGAAGYDGNLAFDTNNTDCISIDAASGKITPKHNGTAKVTVTVKDHLGNVIRKTDGSALTASLNVTVDFKFPAIAINYARTMLGKKYKHVSPFTTTPAGFDCCGLTAWCYYRATGKKLKLPWTTTGQYKYSGRIKPNGKEIDDLSQLRPGDILCFSTDSSSKISHVGLYIGNSDFIHASSGAGRVIQSSFDKNHKEILDASGKTRKNDSAAYWKRNFERGVRIY